MNSQIITTFCETLKNKYNSEAFSIYYRTQDDKTEHLYGEPIENDVLTKYLAFDTPKYIVSESNSPIKDTLHYFSRFVFTTKQNLTVYTFILSSTKKDAYETTTKDILSEILRFKSEELK